MAAYAATVTVPDLKAKKLAATGLGILRGTINLSNYNATLAEITGITNLFRSAPTVLLGGISTNGYLVAWDATAQAVKAWYPTKAITPAGSVAAGVIAVTAGTAGDAVTNNAGVLESSGGQDLAVAAQAFTGTAVAAQAGTEVASDVDVGIVSFVAVGPAP